MQPGYIQALEKGVLQERIKKARQWSAKCCLCPRNCGVNRPEGELGFCRIGRLARVASFNLHFGEEEPLVGERGSGTVFFAHCNLGCIFCQNFDISDNQNQHPEVYPNQLAYIFNQLQQQGAHNINLVTPSHVVLQFLEALEMAAQDGLNIPLVYNTSSYDEIHTLRLLDGIVDIYLADSKFFHEQEARKYADAPDYPHKAREAILEMHRQVGPLQTDDRGIAQKGLMIRHLVMPDNLAGSEEWLEFFAANLSRDTFINIMDQYRPAGNAGTCPELMGRVSGDRVTGLMQKARDLGLTRLDERSSGIFRLIF